MNFDVPYGITKRLKNTTLADARARATAALQAQGFGVLTEIDVQATLKKKLDVDTAPYIILGACNPKLAHRALQNVPAVGLLLPCNVVVAQDGEDAIVSAIAPTAMFSMLGEGSGIDDVAKEADKLLRAALDAT
ncbi:MAG: DUF302 domain-containing protein [Polyangiaceae bacterium]|nr:DUF302 domain-containing protein [Polyangiaceae bacterium]MBK8939756.1 DUF302 domain-containing protein [Polyangiaceae bacterium]